MLFNAKTTKGYSLLARDGEIGKVRDLYFDDARWRVRYAVVDTGGWLSGRRVLVSPTVLGEPDHDEKRIQVDLTREQVESSPDVDTEKPITREYEELLHSYYAWPYYWSEPQYAAPVYYGPLAGAVIPPEAIYRAGATGGAVPGSPQRQKGGSTRDAAAALADDDEAHLQSVNKVTGWTIHARDGDLGHVEDFLISPLDWSIHQLVVDTRNWWPGRKVLVAPGWISAVDWVEREVRLGLSREAIKSSPEYDPETPVSEDYESSLQTHYHATFTER